MAKYTIFDAETQADAEYELTVHQETGEVWAESPTGRVLKFPAGLSKADFEAAVADHKTANEGHEVISPEVVAAQEEQLAASNALLDELNA